VLAIWEESIRFWHEIETGFAGRQPLDWNKAVVISFKLFYTISILTIGDQNMEITTIGRYEVEKEWRKWNGDYFLARDPYIQRQW